MDASPQFFEAVGNALVGTDSPALLRMLANHQLAKGVSRETLMAWFEQARGRFPDREDRLLEVLDCVVGWCSPHQAPDAADTMHTPGADFPVVNSSRPVDVGK